MEFFVCYSVRGYIKATETKTVQQPAWLDTTQPPEQWANASISPQSCDLVLSINLVHISAWPVTEVCFQPLSIAIGHFF